MPLPGDMWTHVYATQVQLSEAMSLLELLPGDGSVQDSCMSKNSHPAQVTSNQSCAPGAPTSRAAPAQSLHSSSAFLAIPATVVKMPH